MALFQGNIFSRTLGFETQVYISLPQDGRRYSQEGPQKTLLLLHGISDNASGWIRYGLADAMAAKYNIAVVVPEGQKGLWLDMKYGGQYTTYLTGELPELMGKMFRVPVNPEHLMIAGLSVGGFGALHAAFSDPETFCAAGSFSGVMDMDAFLSRGEELSQTSDCGANFVNEIVAATGTERRLNSGDDLRELAALAVRKNTKLAVYMAWGREDVLVCEQNQAFSAYLQTLPLDAVCETWAGVHDWTFWNQALDRFLEHILGTPERDDVFGGIPAYRKSRNHPQKD